MANVKKIDWTFIDYLTFINAVVEKTIENGVEYKNVEEFLKELADTKTL